MVTDQRRHEAPDLGDAIVRMLRGLVTRAAEGDTEAIEQLARVEQLAPAATSMGVQLARDRAGYSFTELGRALGISRQAARQRTLDPAGPAMPPLPDAHQLVPGHRRASCELC